MNTIIQRCKHFYSFKTKLYLKNMILLWKLYEGLIIFNEAFKLAFFLFDIITECTEIMIYVLS